MRINQIIVIGCGGTGSHLIPMLARLNTYHPEMRAPFTVCDGDVFEVHNLERQMVGVGNTEQNKADAMLDTLHATGLCGLVTYKSLPRYIHQPDTVAGLLAPSIDKEGVAVVVICVDNDASRKIIYAGIDQIPNVDVLVVDAGNALDTGNVVTWMRILASVASDGEPIFDLSSSHPRERYPQIATPQDTTPGGCAAKTPSTPQLITANAFAAVGCLQVIMNVADNQPFSAHWQYDCRAMRAEMLDTPFVLEKTPDA